MNDKFVDALEKLIEKSGFTSFKKLSLCREMTGNPFIPDGDSGPDIDTLIVTGLDGGEPFDSMWITEIGSTYMVAIFLAGENNSNPIKVYKYKSPHKCIRKILILLGNKIAENLGNYDNVDCYL